MRTTFAFAQAKLQRSVEGRKAHYDQKASQHEFQVGDKVWYYVFAPPVGATRAGLTRKFLPKWTGPHPIVDKLSPVAYKIQARPSKGADEPTHRWVHRNQIKAFHTPYGNKEGPPGASKV